MFKVEGRTWAGRGRAWRVGLQCAKLTPGRQVPVNYLSGDPTRNAATRDPHALARHELLLIGALGTVCNFGIAPVLWAGARFGERSGPGRTGPGSRRRSRSSRH